MSKNLLIVESSGKIKTIGSILGKDFVIKASVGHIRDLVKGDKAIDVANNFAQQYEIPADRQKVVAELKKAASEADVVWLGSDPDREGEAIAWHLYDVLKLDPNKTKRVAFNEITKAGILDAINNPRSINYDLVHAQQARRVLDRLVGFELSPILWKKIKPALSAGRVQSVAVRLVVEREREIMKFNYTSNYKITADFLVSQKSVLKAELPKKFETKKEAEEFVSKCLNASFLVDSLDVKPAKRSSAPPFETSTLQQEASRKFGFSGTRTMRIAQSLYEAGYITYMRTDSVNMSQTAMIAAEKEIKSSYGEQYYNRQYYKNKSANAQEAHEAIRPTYFEKHTITDGDKDSVRLYELIWKRAIASQMSDAIFEKTIVKINVSTSSELFQAVGEVIKFDGFLKVYMESKDDDGDEDDDKSMLPPINVGDKLNLKKMVGKETYSRPPARYTDSSLTQALKDLEIGRPSTYATTIRTIIDRGYVALESRDPKTRKITEITLQNNNISTNEVLENFGYEKNKLFPSDIGMVVNDFLVSNFEKVVDYKFTARVEEEFDEIANGKKEWTEMLHNFYGPFHKDVENITENVERINSERELGIDPVSGKKVYVRIGRFGPLAQIGDSEDEEKRFASLQKGQMLETITLQEALTLFSLPRVVGQFEDTEMKAAVGRFGPYIVHNKLFYSLPKTDNPLTVTRERAIEIILDKREKDANKIIKQFAEDENVQILNGRWGPYISYGKSNVKIPKGTDPNSLSFEDCKKLAEESGVALEVPKTKTAAKKTTASKAKKETTSKTEKKTTTRKVASKKTE